ncbi:OsmC family protein [Noviherbaspirillum aerium]|uniref:OsmC family protein n=1 Tax=Noviherbaspirillum aerium TaxID=2588497 RepID=UPI00124D39B4|nr:OsmC family protein [Noviherbaspirillum aerium]
MHTYEATIAWERGQEKFTDNRYSRGHRWSFDGGVEVPASSSPSVVPEPMSVAAAVDPEEAFVAAISSCHMLTFLWIAGKAGFVVDRYVDQAVGVMQKNAEGRVAVTRVALRPRIDFGGERRPSAEEVDGMHHRAHEDCFIANSVKTEIVIEAPLNAAA